MPGRYNRELRIILDFEMAAIKAAKIIFPTASIEGCAFHLARTSNRKRDQLGLRKFIRGSERCERIKRWWETLKGTIVLPPISIRGSGSCPSSCSKRSSRLPHVPFFS